MEHAPQPHHREGIQNELDKAYDEGQRDNEAIINEEEAKIRVWDEAEAEKAVSPELVDVLSRLRDAGYLDTSFEGKETHQLTIRSLTKDEAFDEYRKSGGAVWDSVEMNKAYVLQKSENLDVMVINFDNNKLFSVDDLVRKMRAFDVRPLVKEELVQYGTAYPSHQEQGALAALGGDDDVAFLDVHDGVRRMVITSRKNDWRGYTRFLVVSK